MKNSITIFVLIALAPTVALIGLFSSLLTGPQIRPQGATSTVLYDAALGNTPDQQQLEYEAVGIPEPQASQTYINGVTVLDSTPVISDVAGYGVTPSLSIVLTRSTGFVLDFTVQITAETHDNNDRAGFSVTLLGEDVQGIELAFWPDEIWAQEGGEEPALFTHAEGVAFDTTAALTSYALEICGDSYTLTSGGGTLLTGSVRDYTAWEPPSPLPDPYEEPNLIALADNSRSGAATVKFAYAAITQDSGCNEAPTATPTMPPTATATVQPTATATPSAMTEFIYLPLVRKGP